ncbi:interleukin 15, like isoform 2-T2 [Anableps anableps]
MLRGGSVLASVFLCSACLLVVPTQPAAPPKKGPCSKDLVSKVTSLNNSLSQQMVNFSLYTPTIEDYKKCPSGTFKCFSDELSVLSEELTINGLSSHRAENLSRRLKGLARSLQQLESDCRPCELHQEESAGSFLGVLLKTVHVMNSGNC